VAVDTLATGRRAARRDRSWGSYGRAPLVALALLGLVEGIEKRVLPAVLSLVQDDLGFSDFQAGLLDTAIIVAALLVAVPAGILADRVERGPAPSWCGRRWSR
jgi:predicted MFS family arabinose efflux permease